MSALPGSAHPLAQALEEELAALVAPSTVRKIVADALHSAGLAEMPLDALVLAAFIDAHLRPALATFVGDDAADDTARRLIELARRSTVVPRPKLPSIPLARVVATRQSHRALRPPRRQSVTEVAGPPTHWKLPTLDVSDLRPASGPPAMPPPSESWPAPVISTSPPAQPPGASSAPPRARSGPAARQVKLTPRPRMRALSDTSKYEPSPFRPSGTMSSAECPSDSPTHRPMPALSSFVIVVTQDAPTGAALTSALSELSVHAFVRDVKTIPPAADVLSVVVLDARDRPVDESVLAALLWRLGTKVVVWGDDETLRKMRRGYGRADHLFRCHTEVSGRELAHVCHMLLG